MTFNWQMSRVRIDEAGFDYVFNSPRGTFGRWFRRRGEYMVRLAKHQAHRRTGLLRARIHMRHERASRGQFIEVSADTRYALMHHQGTRAHVITARHARVLRYTVRGRVHFAQRVLHPGTHANHFLTDPMRVAFR